MASSDNFNADVTKDRALISGVVVPNLLTQSELAKYLGKSTAWCERARWAGDGPRFIKLGRHVRYKAEDVLAWIEDNARTCSGES